MFTGIYMNMLMAKSPPLNRPVYYSPLNLAPHKDIKKWVMLCDQVL